MVARSSPISAVTQPRQLPASSLTSATFFSPATPLSGDMANTAATARARYIFIAALLLSYGDGRTGSANRPVTKPIVHYTEDGNLAPLHQETRAQCPS